MNCKKQATVGAYGQVANRFRVGKNFFECVFTEQGGRRQVGIVLAATVSEPSDRSQEKRQNQE